MTHNQIEYANYKESKRHNIAGEAETQRHNVVTEYEVARHNVETERLGWANLNEETRHHIADETETHRYHTASEAVERNRLAEVQRHNKVTESIDSYRTLNEVQIGYQNASSNRIKALSDYENSKTNRGNMRINEKNAKTNEFAAQNKAYVDRINSSINAFNAKTNDKRVSIEQAKAHIDGIKLLVDKALAKNTIKKTNSDIKLRKYELMIKQAEADIKNAQQKHTAHYDWALLPAKYGKLIQNVGAAALALLGG